jgi:hypothetical protein
MCGHFEPNFGYKNWLLHHDNTVSQFFLHHGIHHKNNMTVVPHSPYFPLFPRLKIKLKNSHFDTIEVIEAESQAVLNALKEHYF